VPVDRPARHRVILFTGSHHRAMVRAIATTSPTHPASMRQRLGILRRSLRRRTHTVIDVPEILGEFDLAKLGRRGLRTFHLDDALAGRTVAPPQTVLGEAHSLRTAGPIGVAPVLIDVSPDGTWIREKLVEGSDLRFSRGAPDERISGSIQQISIPLWNALSIDSVPREHFTGDLVERVCSAADRSCARELDRRLLVATERLRTIAGSGAADVPLVWSHGDLFAKNVIERADGSLLAIDWEYAAVRSPALDAFATTIEAIGNDLTATHLIELAAAEARRSVHDEVRRFFDDSSSAFAIAALELLVRMAGDDVSESLATWAETAVQLLVRRT
jgi:hypothetical protein